MSHHYLLVLCAFSLVLSCGSEGSDTADARKACAWLRPGSHILTAELKEGEYSCRRKLLFQAWFNQYGIEEPEDNVCTTAVQPNEELCSVTAQTMCPDGFALNYNLHVGRGSLEGTVQVIQTDLIGGEHSCTYEVFYLPIDPDGGAQ